MIDWIEFMINSETLNDIDHYLFEKYEDLVLDEFECSNF